MDKHWCRTLKQSTRYSGLQVWLVFPISFALSPSWIPHNHLELCWSPSLTDSWIGWVGDDASIGDFGLLNMWVLYWVGGGVLCLFFDLLNDIFSGLFSFSGLVLFFGLITSIFSSLLSCLCFDFAFALGLDLGLWCFLSGKVQEHQGLS